MNKVITDGITLMPPAFGDGLDVWSSEDGTPGSQTYDGDVNATLISADADFGTCFEVLKSQATQKLRYMGETPLLPGCYLRVSVKVKAISGAFPSVRIAGWAGGAGGLPIESVAEFSDSILLDTYGEVVEVSAIVGGGNRGGVDMVWGRLAIFGHFGIDLTGANGGVVRVEDIVIEDITSVFLRNMMDVVDVQDYGAIGDGVTDNVAAFEAADAAAAGRDVLVPEGIYYLATTVTMNNRVRFEGTVDMPDAAIFQLTKDFGFPAYEEAFGNETLALRKGLQALYNFTDHDTFDLGGRTINLDEPMDVYVAVGNHDTFALRRVIANGEIRAQNTSGWDNETVTQTASYDLVTGRTELTNVTNISTILVGSLVEGNGVGREIYVKDVDVANNKVFLSNPLYDASASQVYTFTRFKYLLDFSGFQRVARMILTNIDFNCTGRASGVMLPKDGVTNTISECYFTSPLNRAITSIGEACSGINIDRNNFLSNEQSVAVADRISIGFNVNVNDAKIRNNRAVRFKHFCVLGSAGYIITGNHFFQGDIQGTTDRTAGIIFTDDYAKTLVSGNYVDNATIEWTSEHNPQPTSVGYSFSGMTIAANHFTAQSVETWFSFIKLKPIGTGHFINGVNISGNVFKVIGTTIDRVESVDNSLANFDLSMTQELSMTNNNFTNVNLPSMNPVSAIVSSSSVDNTWTGNFGDWLPFGTRAMHVTSVTPQGSIIASNGGTVYTMPFNLSQQGTNRNQIKVRWSEPVSGNVVCTVRADVVGMA
tara:strand:- start:12418 stop:14715 length:2298 start_codon:yes stop_codon:yes gene_type:complete